MTWPAATDNAAVTGYDVYRDNVKINSANITTPSYNVTSLTASTTYSIYVAARDAAGNSSNSNPINVTTAAPDIEAPSSPVNLSSSIMAQTSFTLSWNAA